jgi:hypothetical protein
VLALIEHNAKLTAQPKKSNPTASNDPKPAVVKRDTSRMHEVLQKLSKAH